MPKKAEGTCRRAAFPIEQKGPIICIYTPLDILKDS